MKSIDRKILILYTSFTKSKKQKHEKKQKKKEKPTNEKRSNPWGPIYIYIYIYIYIDNFIKTRLYIRRLKNNLMYKLYMVGFLCPPKVQMD